MPASLSPLKTYLIMLQEKLLNFIIDFFFTPYFFFRDVSAFPPEKESLAGQAGSELKARSPVNGPVRVVF